MYVSMLNNTVHGPNKHNITSKCVHIMYLFRDVYRRHAYNAKSQIYTMFTACDEGEFFFEK